MGFESSDVARRRLAAMAMSNRRVQEALATQGAESVWSTSSAGQCLTVSSASERALVDSLELLAQDIADTPGAGGALLAAFAEQVRVLRLVAQATDRSPGSPLPPTVLSAVRAAISQAAFAGTEASPPSWSAAPRMV